MASLESIATLLDEASRLLDRAAGEIRDVPLDPTRKNILRIAQALDEIGEIRIQVSALRPELEPDHLKGPLNNPAKALTTTLERARQYEQDGARATSLALLRQFLRKNPPEAEREAAVREIGRLGGGNTSPGAPDE